MSTKKHSDEELLCLLKQGDESVMEIIVLRYWESLYRVAFNVLEDRQSCEDIVQEIFIKIWQKRETIKISYTLKAYLYAATRYEIFRLVRKKVKQKDRLNLADFANIEVYNPHNELEYEELLVSVQKIVESLPKRSKEVYLLSREEQLSHKEISIRLKIAPKTVENHITIALNRLRSLLNKTLF